ncbi:MAG: ABC transporter permease [Dehalococcoidia bacterium]|nr:ABC transporter permease [Dehalococcoidia bacterium]
MRAILRLTLVEMKLFVREPLALVFVFAFPLFVLFVLGGVFGNDVDLQDEENLRVWRGVGPADYYQPAYIGLVMASVGLITMPLRITSYREQGVLRRFEAAGVAKTAILGSQLLVGLGMMTVGAAAIVVASNLSQGTSLSESWGLTVPAYLLSAITFAVLGLMLGSVLPGSRAAQGAGMLLFFVMMFISGAGPPREVLANGMKGFSELLPLTHVILLLQDTWLAAEWDGTASLVVAAFLVVAGAVTLRFFRWE